MIRRAAPNHDGTATMLHCLLHTAILDAFSVVNPAPRTSIGTKSVNFGLIGPDDTFPVRLGPVLVITGKLKPCLHVLGRESRFALLLNTAHPGLLERSRHRHSTDFFANILP